MHPVLPPHFYPESHHVLPPHFYPPPSVMEMKQHHSFIPSVQQQYPTATPAGVYPYDGHMYAGVHYPTLQPPQHAWPLLAKRKCTLIRIHDPNAGGRDVTMDELLGGRATSSVTPPPCEGEDVQDGCINTPQAPATDVLTLDEHVAPISTSLPVPEPEPQPASDLPPVQSNDTVFDASPSTPPAPTALTWGEIMDTEDAQSSTPPTPLTWGEIMNAKDAELEEVEKQKEQVEEVVEQMEKIEEAVEQAEQVEEVVKQKVKEIREQKEQIEEVVEQKKQVEFKQQLPDKIKKLPMDMLHHSKNTKRVELFIRSLDYSVDDKHLYKEFLPFKAIISAKVMMENGRSRGFGYVSYSSATEATTAIKEMNGKMLGRWPLYVALSKSREERKPYLARTEQRTGSSQPTKPWQSPHKHKQRVQPQRHPSVAPTRQERK